MRRLPHLRALVALALAAAAPRALAAGEPSASPAPPASAPAPGGGPASSGRLVIEKDVVDLGDVVRGKEATGVFTLRNTGDTVLKILEAKPG